MKKCFVIGLDGVPYSLIGRYIKEGYLPNLKRILDSQFVLCQMDASIPDISSTSWTSFMTGVNPAEHGIYGFMDLREGTYQLFFPNSRDILAPAFWEILGGTVGRKTSTLLKKYEMKFSSPYRSIILNVPQTYPASPLNGILSAGFVAVDLKKATYPESAFNYLSSIGYAIDVDARKAVDQKDMFVKEMFDTFEKRVKAVKHFMAEEPWDVFVAVVTETDRLNHFFFDAAYSSEHPYCKPFIHFYQEIDRFVGEMFENFMKLTDGQGFFMVMSDHGFTELKEEVYINNWLIREGFLKIKHENEYFEKIDTGTKAFAMDPARIYINTEKRFPRGSVKESEKRPVMEELISALTLLKGSDGNRVVKAIHIKEQLYHGPLYDKAPDLVCIPNDGYDLKATFQKKNIFGKGHFTGMHTRHDAHCILPVHIQHSEKLHIEDLAVYILDYFAADQ